MKQLILMRHAKAKSKFEGIDFDRPLTKSGIDSIEALSLIFKRFLIPNPLFFVSNSIRTRETFFYLHQQFKKEEVEVSFENSLYHASFEELLSFIKQIENTNEQVVLIAHNPGLNQLASVCLNNEMIQFPPSSYLVLEAPIEHWHDFNLNHVKVLYLSN
jgi:phosphohistidine phosphatase